MTTRRRWPGPGPRERPAWARMYEGGGLISDDLYALEEEDDVRPRATTDAIPVPDKPAVSPLIPMLAGGISGFVVGLMIGVLA